MTLEDYEQEVVRTCGATEVPDRLTMGAMGLSGEAGEVSNQLKKVLFHEHDFDVPLFIEELGDCLWYITMLANTMKYSLEDVMERNRAKLRERYPDGFDPERSKHREEP